MSRGPDTLITPDIFRTVAKPSVEHFPARRSCLKTGFDFMIRYSSYRGTNYRTNPSAPTEPLCSVAREFRELQDLRERVKNAEAAAAARLRPRGRGHLQNND
jgi:hypothetical protein